MTNCTKDLINTGVLDSLAVMQIILFIEERFSIKVADDEVLPENFRTVNRIDEFVAHKLNGAQAAS